MGFSVFALVNNLEPNVLEVQLFERALSRKHAAVTTAHLSVPAEGDQPITSHFNIGASKHETRLKKTINKEIDIPIPDIRPNSQN